jgi:hypothetical protein
VTLVQVLGMVAAGVASLGVIHRGLLLPAYRWAKRIEKAMGFVEEQMRPNSGSSLRDSLDRIENRLTLVEMYITKPD